MPAGADRRRRLVTPEGVDLGVTLGDAGQRIGAFMIDMMLILALLVGLTLVITFGFGGAATSGEALAVVWLLGAFLLRNFYFIAMELRPRGATFGKRWVGLRVVARDGGRLTGDAVIARNLMREVEVFLPLALLAMAASEGHVDALTGWLGFGWTAVFLFFPLFNRDRLRVGDLLAGTWVIRTRRQRIARDLAAPEEALGFDFAPEQLDAYGIYELETLEGVLRGADAAARRIVAQAIVDRIGWRRDVHDVDRFLAAYYAQLRAHLEQHLLLGRRRTDKHDR